MAYDEALAERVRDLLMHRGDLIERKMFGGVAWMISGNMACGVLGDGLIVRVGADETERALAEEHTRPFEMAGRASKGFVVVEPSGLAEPDDLAQWVETGAGFASSLPPK